HVVAAMGELEAELGGDDAAAAVGRIAGDADFHKRGTRRAVPMAPCRFSSGEATSPPPNQTRTVSPSGRTEASQTTMLSQRSEPSIAPGSFSQATPSIDRAR